MNDLIRQVTPLTAGIIWMISGDFDVTTPFYEEMDYLLDGLLTANLKVSPIETSQVIVGKNYNKSLYVLILKEAKSNEIESYVSLFKKDLNPESDIIILDVNKKFENYRKDFKDVANHLRTFQR